MFIFFSVIFIPAYLEHAREMVDALISFHLFGALDRDTHICPVEIPCFLFGDLAHAECTGHFAD